MANNSGYEELKKQNVKSMQFVVLLHKYPSIKLVSLLYQIYPVQFLAMFVCLMVFNAAFNNISVVSCRSVLLGDETGETTD